tara:strand:- start:9 stop:227 length:219 start_codon:yes stop_codon:yes gene_type:complete
MKKEVALTLAVVSFSGCLYSSEPNIVKGGEILQEITTIQSNEKNIATKRDLRDLRGPTAHCYYWEPTENIKK